MNATKTIYIFSGGLKKNDDGSWRTTLYNEKGDSLGVLGDRMRIIAAMYLYNDDTNINIITSGGIGKYYHDTESPNASEVMKKELTELNVPKEKIIEHPQANSTYEQLLDVLNLLEKGCGSVSLVSNRYHIPRIRAMIESIKTLQSFQKYNYQMCSAEEIAITHDSKRWETIINNAYHTTEMQERLKLEEKGIIDIQRGDYIL